ncbi:MAG: protein kinase [Planctomycetales bacterium]|nr:protein kinase [Planctomycetales bacterium]
MSDERDELVNNQDQESDHDAKLANVRDGGGAGAPEIHPTVALGRSAEDGAPSGDRVGTSASEAHRVDEGGKPTHSQGEEVNRSTVSIPSSSSKRHSLSSGTLFAHYRIERQLGQGAMGTVYLATDQKLGRPVALKIPQFEDEDQGEVRSRFLREAKSAATIHHPNVCPVFEFGDVDGQCYLVMAFIEGAPLSSFLTRGKSIPERQAALLVRKLALALQEAHRRGVVHRDLKPSNIMIDQRREPIVMDFGLARRDQHDDTHLTRTGVFLGTPSYTSPEQIRNLPDSVGPRSDIYTLGVIFYELLTGHLPFEGGGVMSILSRIMTEEPKPAIEVKPDLNPACDLICRRAMAKIPDERYGSMAEFARDLTLWLKGKFDHISAVISVTELDDLAPEAMSLAEPETSRAPGQDPSERLTAARIDFLQTPLPVMAPTRADRLIAARKSRKPWALMGLAGLALIAITLIVASIIALGGSRTATVTWRQANDTRVREILIEGRPVSPAELVAGLELPPGEYSIAVTAVDCEPLQESFVLEEGTPLALAIRLVPVASDPSTPLQGVASDRDSNATVEITATPPSAPSGPGTSAPSMGSATGSAVPWRLDEDIVFDDFESDEYDKWTQTGIAFGAGPALLEGEYYPDIIRSWLPQLGRVAHSVHYWRDNRFSGPERNWHGKLESVPFEVTRPFINFWVFGAFQPGKAEIRLIVDGQVVRSQTGHDGYVPVPASWDVTEYLGRQAKLEILDQADGAIDSIGIDDIRFSDENGVAMWKRHVAQRIEEESITWEGHRYWLSGWDMSSFGDARAYSIFEEWTGTSLVTIESEREQAFLQSQTSYPYWLGLRSIAPGRWADRNGVEATYFNWLKGFPDSLESPRIFVDELGNCTDMAPWGRRPSANRAQLIFEWDSELPAAHELNTDDQREAAEVLITRANWIRLRTARRFVSLQKNDELPDEDFEVWGFELPAGTELTSTELATLTRLRTLRQLSLKSAPNEWLALLGTNPQLRMLYLQECDLKACINLPVGMGQELRELRFNNCSWDEAGMRRFAAAKSLRDLDFSAMYFQRPMLETFSACEHLQALWLNYIGDISLRDLMLVGEFKELDWLVLWGCNLHDEDLVALNGLHELEHLQLGENSNLKGTGLTHLAGCQRLNHLSLYRTGVDETTLMNLPVLPRLELLSLGNTPIARIPLGLASRLPALKDLEFPDTSVDGDSFVSINEFPFLRRIDYRNSRFPAEDMTRLQQTHGTLH